MTRTRPATRLSRTGQSRKLWPLLLALAAFPQAAGATGYEVGAGDKLTITVFGQTELTGDYVVGDDGLVLIPIVGGIPVAGLSLLDAQRQIAARLADGYLNQPVVGAKIAELRPIYVVGDVRSPGSFTFRFGATVMSGVALAGGFGRPELAASAQRLDLLQADERVRSLETRFAALTLRLSRLEAQWEGAAEFSPARPAGMTEEAYAELSAEEVRAFRAETEALAREMELLRQQKPRIEADIASVKVQLEAETTQLELIREHLAGFTQLMAAGYARRYTGIELQREEARNRGNVARLSSELARLDLAILEGQIRIQQAAAAYRRRLMLDLDGTRERMAEIRATLPTAREARAIRLQQGGSLLPGAGEPQRDFAVIRVRGGQAQRIPASETTPLMPGDVVEVTARPPAEAAGSAKGRGERGGFDLTAAPARAQPE